VIRPRTLMLVILLASALSGVLASGASAASEPGPHLDFQVQAAPTHFTSADNAYCEPFTFATCDQYRVTAFNNGSVKTHGAITITATLPPGLREVGQQFLKRRFVESPEFFSEGNNEGNCKATGQTLKCHYFGSVAPGQTLALLIQLTVEPGAASGETFEATLTGGESPSASLTLQTSLEPAAPFGVSALHAEITDPAGEPQTEAGSHPYEFTTKFDFNSVVRHSPESQLTSVSIEDPRDVVLDLPPGFVGSALAAPKCTEVQITTVASCPKQTQIGYVETQPESIASINSAIYNMVPQRGVAAEFGFVDILHNAHFIYTKVVPGSRGYVLRSTTPEIPQTVLTSVIATFFGDPAVRDKAPEPAPPLFTMPSNCSGEELETQIHIDSWQNPSPNNIGGSPDFSDSRWAAASSKSAAVSGCEQLHFEPSLEGAPETNRADSPTGLNVTFKVPQNEGAEELGTPPLRKTVVTLPAGMSVNPSSANGLKGCSLAQIGISASGQPDGAAPECPDASKLGTVELQTPALPGTLEGQIYLAKQTENPFGKLLAIYIVINDPTTGVLVKLPGEVRADPSTGQLQTVVDNNPQFPFSELRAHFFGGQRAALRTPPICGTYKISSELTPWSAPESGPPATPSSSFQIVTSANGEPCPASEGARPNSPGFSAGTREPFAASYSPFLLHIARQDGSQEFGSLSVAMPPGLVGKLAGISECPEAALAAVATKTGAAELASPSCPASSKVGTVTVGAGAGLEPYYATGQIYLAGPYKGAPLSLAIITPAVAGPYDLGDVVVRNALQVDPETTRITAVSDPIPHILQGIPLDVRSIEINADRQSFILNPTNCERFSVAATETSTLGTQAALSNPFQVGGCAKLGFKPHLSLTLKGKVTRAATPRLIAKLTYPKGTYANVASAQVTLPPSAFLDNAHIQTICTRVQFSAGTKLGENCPAKSIYGRARAVTPLLDAPLSGPVYLRSSSHELPDLVVALDGQVPVALDGRTDSVKGALRNTFEAVPDAPVTSFEVELFGGKRGLIEMSSGFCKNPRAKVKFTGQNGKVQETRPKVGGSCGRKAKKRGGGKTKGGKGK
jgi:hypothetical protein